MIEKKNYLESFLLFGFFSDFFSLETSSSTFSVFLISFSELLITFSYNKFLSYLIPINFLPEGSLQLLSTDYKIAISFIILVLVLILKPTGIYKGKLL